MKILKQLTVESKGYTYRLLGDYHHVDDDAVEGHAGYSQGVIYESFSYDEVAEMAMAMYQANKKIKLTDLFAGNASVPLEEPYAKMNRRA